MELGVQCVVVCTIGVLELQMPWLPAGSLGLDYL